VRISSQSTGAKIGCTNIIAHSLAKGSAGPAPALRRRVDEESLVVGILPQVTR
jgi:hypothetical protein